MPLVRTTAALLAAAAVTGCGGDGAVTQVRGERVEITLDDFFLTPHSLRAERGRVTFAVTNHGRLPHNFRLRGPDGEPVAITTLLPGDDAADAADLAPGGYTMLCTVANHEQLGMTGRLVVR